jgi:hypothetical protein
MTRSEYLTYIKRTFLRTDKDTELIDALNDTLYDLTTTDGFQVKQTETEFVLTNDTYSYTYPSTYALLISGIKYIDSGGGGRMLNMLSKEIFDTKYPHLKESNFTRGDSVDCTIYEDEIYLAPYLQTVNGQKIYVSGSIVSLELDDDSDSPDFQDRFSLELYIEPIMIWKKIQKLQNG